MFLVKIKESPLLKFLSKIIFIFTKKYKREEEFLKSQGALSLPAQPLTMMT